MYTLTAEKRGSVRKTASAWMADGKMPAVVYGPKQESTPIALPQAAFLKVFREAGESSVIELAGVSESPLQVLIHDVDRDPVTNAPRHADFYAIEKGAKVEVAVPLTFVNESPAVKGGANLVKVMHELPIEAAPADLPHEISVDISVLINIGDQIHVRDLVLPARVEAKVDIEDVVALIQEVKEEVEEAPTTIDMDSIEVEAKGKEAAAEGEEAAAGADPAAA